MFLRQKGHDIQPAIAALAKLAALGGNHSVWSSHPAPAKRAKRLPEYALTPTPDEDSSLLSRMVNWLKHLKNPWEV
jgi:putative metalloprotease